MTTCPRCHQHDGDHLSGCGEADNHEVRYVECHCGKYLGDVPVLRAGQAARFRIPDHDNGKIEILRNDEIHLGDDIIGTDMIRLQKCLSSGQIIVVPYEED